MDSKISSRISRWFGVLVLAAPLAIACVEDGGGGDDGQVVPDAGGEPLPACAQTLADRQQAVAAQLDGWPIADAPEMVASGGDQSRESDYAGKYRDDLASHPGCAPREAYDGNSEPFMSDNQAQVPAGTQASIPGYPCAAKEYDQPAEDTSRPIVILVHGNSSGVPSFEEYHNPEKAGTELQNFQGFAFTMDSAPSEQLASKLLAAGHRVIAFDARVDLVATLEDWDSESETGNPFMNIDHGWTVPMLQSLIKAVMVQNPNRKVSLVGHSLGVTAVRDALRRLYLESVDGASGAVNPFAHVADVILLSGANHGVGSGPLCDKFEHMRGTVACEMGDRAAYMPTYFLRRLNGPNDLFAAPCADGDYAFGTSGACNGNRVDYLTVTMEDIPGGELQDEFVSEDSSQLNLDGCVDNQLIGLDGYDSSGYFFTNAWGFLANHFGSARAPAGMQLVLDELAD